MKSFVGFWLFTFSPLHVLTTSLLDYLPDLTDFFIAQTDTETHPPERI